MKSVVRTKQISELFDYQPKSGRKAGDGLDEGLVPFYTSGQTQSKYLNVHDFEGDSLVLGTGGKPSVHFATGKFSATNDCFVIKPKNENEIHPKYLYYYFLNKMYLLENGFRGAGLKHLSRSYFNDLVIPIFNYHTSQLRIIDILDKADTLRQKRKKSIKLLDDFLRSTFLEMFGDPVVNPKGWDVIKFGDICDELRYGTSVKCLDKPFSESLPVLRIPNIIGNKIEYSDFKYCNLPEKEVEKLLLKKGDLLFVRTNGNPEYIARCGVFNESKRTLFASYLIRARLKLNSQFYPTFLQTCFSTKSYRSKITKETRTTAGNYNINTKGLQNFDLICAPFDLQNKFADIVQQVEKLKAKYKESEKELDNLFGSLMQRAFRGEL